MGHGGIIDNPVLAEMAKSYNKSVAQLCIRYIVQLGLIVLPKSSNPDHIKSNGEVDFVISDKDMETLKKIELAKDKNKNKLFFNKNMDNF